MLRHEGHLALSSILLGLSKGELQEGCVRGPSNRAMLPNKVRMSLGGLAMNDRILGNIEAMLIHPQCTSRRLEKFQVD